jgi:hypothetical protein
MSQQLIVTQGKVTNTDDPAKAGRIKVALAELDGAEFPDWVDPVFAPGWLWLPEPGDTVSIILPDGEDLIEFSDEIRWTGQLFDQDNPHPDEFKPNYPQMRGFKTKAGHILIVDDKDKIVSLKTPAGHELLLDEKNDKISFRYKDTDVITINASGIFFGTESASEPFVLGNLWKAMMDTVLQALAVHIHPTGVGPSGPPDNASVYTTEKGKTADTISDFIFGQKVQP